jgi:pSer/pThr/pTyr-binding forkhead associated (FHA) protein
MVPTPAPRPAASQEPIPASELVKKPAPEPTGPKFGVTIVAGYAQGQRFRLPASGCQIGRSRGVVLFPEDATVAPHHATLSIRDGRLSVRDEGTVSGVLVSIGAQEMLYPSGFFSVGKRLFRYLGALASAAPLTPGQPTIYGAPISTGQALYGMEEVLLGGRPGRAVVSPGPMLTVGQQHCDFNYAGEEGIAPRHCEIIPSATSASLRDLSGALGTFVRIGAGVERVLNPGDRFRIGEQILQVDPVA